MVRQWQELFYDQRYATDLSDNPDFVAIARAYGIDAVPRWSRRTAPTTSSRASSPRAGPALLHCACHPTENVWPMIPAGMTVDELMEARA